MENTSKIFKTTGQKRLFSSIVETVGNTPVIKLNKISPEGVQMYVKVESFNPAGSVKDRLALNIIEAAERSGKLKPGQTVVEATSGNTGIGLATVCAAKGYPLVVTMADSFSIERRKLMRFLGAKVVLTPRAQKGLGMYKKAKELAKKNNWFLAHQFETDANADIHEATTGKEILSEFDNRYSRFSTSNSSNSAPARCIDAGIRSKPGMTVGMITSVAGISFAKRSYTVGLSLSLSISRPVLAFPWASTSTNNTRISLAANAVARLTAVVVFPTPPFWFAIAIMRGRIVGWIIGMAFGSVIVKMCTADRCNLQNYTAALC